MGSRQSSELRSIPSNRKTNGAAVATSDFVETGAYGEWRVVLHGQDSWFPGRLCAARKSARSIQQAHRRLERKSLKKQISTRPGTFEFAKYVLVFTTRFGGSTAEILELYRGR
jgi:hypothetical protein